MNKEEILAFKQVVMELQTNKHEIKDSYEERFRKMTKRLAGMQNQVLHLEDDYRDLDKALVDTLGHDIKRLTKDDLIRVIEKIKEIRRRPHPKNRPIYPVCDMPF